MLYHTQSIALTTLTFEFLGGSIGSIQHLTVYCLNANRHLSHMYPLVRLLLVIKLLLVSLTLHSFRYPSYAELQARYTVHIVHYPALQSDNDSAITLSGSGT